MKTSQLTNDAKTTS